jgi:hypothetical protein
MGILFSLAHLHLNYIALVRIFFSHVARCTSKFVSSVKEQYNSHA